MSSGNDITSTAPNRLMWIDYRIRTSPRARNVRLQLSIRDGLTVVVPRNYDHRRIPAIVEKK